MMRMAHLFGISCSALPEVALRTKVALRNTVNLRNHNDNI